MDLRHPGKPRSVVPTLWLMTDERMGEDLWPALACLPRGSGVVFRHLATESRARAVLFARVAQVARRNGLVLVKAGATRQPLLILSGHSQRESLAARRAGADLVLVSPIYPTRTHPGGATLGVLRAAAIARVAGIPAIALGGMTHRRSGRLKALGFAGWAAIDGLTPRRAQKRKAVPT